MITYENLNVFNAFKLFEFLKKNDEKHFKPHKFDIVSIVENSFSKDVYIIQMFNDKVVGYGILRGWEEGYDVPCLGIMIDIDHRGMGLSKKLMDYLHNIAKEKNSDKVMLKVYKDNIKAVNLYRSLDYELTEYNKDLFIGYKKIKY